MKGGLTTFVFFLTFLFFTGMYELLLTEQLHVKEHISNVVLEIIPHLSANEKPLFEKTLELVARTKDQLHGSDYQEMAVVLAKQLRG